MNSMNASIPTTGYLIGDKVEFKTNVYNDTDVARILKYSTPHHVMVINTRGSIFPIRLPNIIKLLTKSNTY